MPVRSERRPVAWGVWMLVAALANWSCGQADGPVPSPSASAAPVAPADWPMYGGNASRSNYNAGRTRLAVSTVSTLAPRWQANVGSGQLPPSGTPAVASGRVFVGSSVAKGDNFFAIDAASGRRLWSAHIGHGSTSAGGIGIGAGPAVSGSIVVAGGGDQAYYGLDAATGRVLWRNPMDAGESAFPWCSPLVAAGRAYVGIASEFDNPAVRGELRALDLATGAVLGRLFFVPEGVGGAGIWNSPALSTDGRTLLVATGEDNEHYDGPLTRALVAVDPITLAVLQADKQGVPNDDQDWATTPIIFHDRSGRALAGANHKDGLFYAYVLDAISRGPLWQRETGLSIGFMPAYDPDAGDGGILFIAGEKGQIFAVDPATGTDRWAPVTLETGYGNMALANGLLFVAAASGKVFVLEAATGRILRQLTPANPGRSFSGIAVAGDAIYWLSGGTLNAWGVP
jgi:outer membrane protein assembly factor BamB